VPILWAFAREDFPQIASQFIETGKVLAAFANFPLTGIHPHAADAAIAAECAYRQGKFWQLHDAIFESRTRLDPVMLSDHAQELGLDMARYKSCFSDAGRNERVAAFVRGARQIGAEGTPTFLIGMVSGRQVKAVKRLNGAARVDVLSRELDALIRKSS
jgi:protein-disulfide isomerase